MSNSSLVNYTKISPNKNHPRNHKIDTITIHCMAGQLSVESCANVFATTARQASSNYGVGPDGRIGLYVDEGDRSWASSNAANDHRAVTIEVASDTTPPYAVTQAAYNATIKLCADICKRNGIKELKWQGNPNLIGQVDKQNMTAHKWFNKSKSCPGDYLYTRFGDIAAKVNAILNPQTTTSTTTSNTNYKGTPCNMIVKVKVNELNIRNIPILSGSKVVGTIHKNESYTIVESYGTWGKLKSGAGWINCSNSYVTKVANTAASNVAQKAQTTTTTTKTTTTKVVEKPNYKVGKDYTLQDEMVVRTGPGTQYAAKKYNQLTTGAKKFDKDKDGAIDKGTVVTCQEVKTVGNNIWIRIPSGWIAGFYNNITYVK